MPVLTEIDAEAAVVLHTATQQPSVADITAALEGLYSRPEFHSGVGTVWDFRAGTVEHLAVDEIQEILRFVVQRLEARGLGRAAIVVSQDVDHSVASMFDGRTDGVPIDRRVFWDLNEATRWASRPPWDEEDA